MLGESRFSAAVVPENSKKLPLGNGEIYIYKRCALFGYISVVVRRDVIIAQVFGSYYIQIYTPFLKRKNTLYIIPQFGEQSQVFFHKKAAKPLLYR